MSELEQKDFTARMPFWWPDLPNEIPTFADYGLHYINMGLFDCEDRTFAREQLWAVRHNLVSLMP